MHLDRFDSKSFDLARLFRHLQPNKSYTSFCSFCIPLSIVHLNSLIVISLSFILQPGRRGNMLVHLAVRLGLYQGVHVSTPQQVGSPGPGGVRWCVLRRLIRVCLTFSVSLFYSFGKRSAGSSRRGCECIVLEASEMIAVRFPFIKL